MYLFQSNVGRPMYMVLADSGKKQRKSKARSSVQAVFKRESQFTYRIFFVCFMTRYLSVLRWARGNNFICRDHSLSARCPVIPQPPQWGRGKVAVTKSKEQQQQKKHSKHLMAVQDRREGAGGSAVYPCFQTKYGVIPWPPALPLRWLL